MSHSVRSCFDLLVLAMLCCCPVPSELRAEEQPKDTKDKDFVQYTVESYRITHFGKGKGRPDLGAWLILYSKENTTGVAGAIGFYTPDGLKAAADYLDADNRPQGAMPISQRPAVLSMMQNSKQPVYLYWSGGPWQTTFLDSGTKPLTRTELEGILKARTSGK